MACRGKLAKQFKKWTLPFLLIFTCIGLTQFAHAAEYRSGKFKASIDTTISAGASFRVEEQSNELSGTSKGNDNFDKDDLVALPLKGSNDIEVNYGNVGAFVRFTYLYDPVIEGKEDDERAVQAVHDRLDAHAAEIEAVEEEGVGQGDAQESAQGEDPEVAGRKTLEGAESFAHDGQGDDQQDDGHGVLEEVEILVPDRRQDHPERLWKDDETQILASREANRLGGFGLPL